MGITVRETVPSDIDTIFAWRNDPVTISTSRSGAALKFEVLRERFTNDSTTWLIAEFDGSPAGVVWFKRGRAGVFESSVILSPDFRGRKLSFPILSSCMEWMRMNKGAAFFATEIKDTNEASIKMFERAGFVHVHPTPSGFGAYCTGLPRQASG